MPAAPVRRTTAAAVLAAAISLSAAACSSSGGGGGTAAGTGTADASPVSATTVTVGSTIGATIGASGSATAAGSSTSVDACSLLTSGTAKSLGLTLGTGRSVTAGDLTECAYDDAGPLIIAVLDGPFTKSSFQSMINTQDNGPYASTTGKSTAIPGLGDAAYAYAKTGIVEVLKGSTVISITAANLATAEKVAAAVLVKLS